MNMITDRALLLASRASCDARTAQSWIDHPLSVRPKIAARLAKAAEQDSRPTLVDAATMAALDQIVDAMPNLVKLSKLQSQRIAQLEAEVAELRDQPKGTP